ncbi:MAG: MFS transporter [Bryobacteraceae bacterium]
MSAPSTLPFGPFEAATYRKIGRRLMPYLFLCYLLAYVNRVNVSFAKLQMQADLRMSDTVYGAGAGIFFIGYFFFEIPANMILQKLGARLWLGSIMMAWGVVSICTMFVKGAFSFYALRLLLGVVESGFFPGVILYLTFWYTRKHRAKMVAAFMSAIPVSSVVASPISGWILKHMAGLGHLASWQWLFLTNGIPSVLMGMITFLYLPDSPLKSAWLNQEEKDLVASRLDEEEEVKKQAGGGKHQIGYVFRSPRVWLFCLIYFGIVMGQYGLTFWLPQVIKETLSADPQKIGWILVIPWGAATVAMILAGRHSDITGERRWHIAGSVFVGGAAFAVSAIPGISGAAGLAALTFAAMGIVCANSLFWAMPTAVLSGAAAAAGIAWINSVGNLAGYVGPYVVGLIRDKTHSMFAALLVLSAAALTAALLTLYVMRKRPSTASAGAAAG